MPMFTSAGGSMSVVVLFALAKTLILKQVLIATMYVLKRCFPLYWDNPFVSFQIFTDFYSSLNPK